MSDDRLFPPQVVRDVTKTGECFQCGARDGNKAQLEVCVWVKADGSEVQHPKMRMQCKDEAACDARIHSNMKKAEIIGIGPVRVKI